MGIVKRIKKFEVWVIDLNPTIGSEIKKARPCVVVSPDSVNKYLNTVIIVPLTTTIRSYPSRVSCTFQGINGQAMIDQMRGLDKARFKKKLGTMDPIYNKRICDTIVETFKWDDSI